MYNSQILGMLQELKGTIMPKAWHTVSAQEVLGIYYWIFSQT